MHLPKNFDCVKPLVRLLQGVDIMAWKQYWISYRFERLEKMLQAQQGKYSHGDSITMADCCLIPQVRSWSSSTAAISDNPICTTEAKSMCDSLAATLYGCKR